MIFTPAEERVLDVLSAKGFDARDLAGLTLEELQDELPTEVPEPILESLRKKVWHLHCKPRMHTWKQLLPSGPCPHISSSASAPARGLLKPTGPHQPTVSSTRQYKHQNVAVALVEAVLHPGLSFAMEDLQRSGTAREVWIATTAESLLARFQPGTLAAVLRTWNRLVQWQLETEAALGPVSDVLLHQFLQAQGRRGRTVPASVYNHLRWLTDNLKVSFPLDSPMLKDFTAASGATTTWPTQVKTLSAQVWRHLLQLATSSSTSSLALAAGLVIRFAVSGLRFKHCARASFEPELSSIRTGVWKVSHGKDGMPFAVALPMYVEPGHPLLSHVQARVRAILGVGTPFLPDMWFDAQGSVVLRSAPADYPRFQAFARSLLHLPPLSLTEHAASTFSTRSFRRFLPTVADALQLCDSDRLCLGNWSDGRKLPLPVRYSSERLESAAQVRRLCLASVHHLLKHAPLCDSWSGLRAVAPHVARLRSNIATSSWGPGVRAIPEPDLVESSPVSTERASSSGGSDSPSSDASTEYLLAPAGDAPTDPESVCFVCPAKGLWHAAAEPQSLTPLCSSRVFRQQGIVWATGLTAALDLHGKFCAPCLLKVAPETRLAILSRATPRS